MKLLLSLFLLCSPLFAVPENQLLEKLPEVLSFYDQGISHFYEGVAQKKVHYKEINQEGNCTLIMMPGRTEPTRKYAELAYDLKDLGCDYYLWDPRGQGFSERLSNKTDKGYVENYDDYLVDFKTFWDLAIAGDKKQEEKESKKVAIIAHSMGAAIALGALAKYNLPVVGLTLSSPMMEIKTQSLPESVTFFAMKALKLAGKKHDYVPGFGPYKGEQSFQDNRVTSSEARHQMALTTFRNSGGEDLNMGGATVNWLIEGIRLGRSLNKKKSKRVLANYPILLFQAGLDTFSRDKRQKKFCTTLAKCQLVRFEKSKHEMFQERDGIRDIVLNKVRDFLKPKL